MTEGKNAAAPVLVMTQSTYQRMLAGLCADCDNPLNTGPMTAEQIEATCKDMGISTEEFSDVCDDCFVKDIAGSDAKYAAHLLGRPVKLRNTGLVFRTFLGVANG